MSDNVFDIPETIKRHYNPHSFEHEFLGYPAPKEYNEFEKIQIKRAMFGGKNYTRLNSSLVIYELMDIPTELFKGIEFISERKVAITFFESQEFCVEKYFQTNFDVITDKNFIIKYLNNEGFAIRTDSYTIEKLDGVQKEPLTNEIKDITVKIILECNKHDISTCKE